MAEKKEEKFEYSEAKEIIFSSGKCEGGFRGLKEEVPRYEFEILISPS